MFSTILAIGFPLVRLLLRITDQSDRNPGDMWQDFQDVVRGAGGAREPSRERSMARQLEEIQDRIIEQISQQLNVDFGRFEKDELDHVVANVATALQAAARGRIAGIPADQVSPKTVQSLILTQSVTTAWNDDLDARQRILARRIVTEASHRIVRIIKQYPDFSISLLETVTQRTQTILEFQQGIQEALNTLPTTISLALGRELGSQRHVDLADYELEYRRAVEGDYDKLEVYGLDLEWRLRSYSLTTSYISLRLQDGARADSTIFELLQPDGVLILIGAAGAGKTTLLQYLAVNAARGQLGTTFEADSPLPVFLRLRNYATAPLPTVSQLTTETTRECLLREPDGFLARAAKLQPFLLLLDGLDEFPESRLEELRQWAQGIKHALVKLSVVATARPTASKAADVLSDVWHNLHKSADVMPMDREEIRRFVFHWHAAVGENLREKKFGWVEGRPAKVADRLASDRDLRRLASSPLLCAALCALFDTRSGALPNGRIELYDDLTTLLLRRDRVRSIDHVPGTLTERQARRLLQEISEFFLENGLSEAGYDRVLRCVERWTKDTGQENVDPTDALDALITRSGILRAPSELQVDFVHRSLLEFLGAQSLVWRDRIELLGRHADDPAWSGALCLAAGLANEKQLHTLIADVQALAGVGHHIRPGQQVPPWLIGVCAGILDAAMGEVPATVRDFLLGTLQTCLPPTSAEAEAAIVSAGHHLLDRVVESVSAVDIPEDILDRAIRAIAEIGGDAGLTALASLPAERRTQAFATLCAVWSFFDPSEFVERVLAGTNPDHGLRIVLTDPALAPYLSELPGHVRIDGWFEFPGTEILTQLEGARLDELVVSNCQLANFEGGPDWSTVLHLPYLKSLDLSGLKDVSLSFPEASSVVNVRLDVRGKISLGVRADTRLDLLEIHGPGTIEVERQSVEGVGRLGRLELHQTILPTSGGCVLHAEEVLISESFTLSTLDIVSLDEIKSLEIRAVRGVSGLPFLEHCVLLETLEVTDCADIADLTSLETPPPKLAQVVLAGVNSLESLDGIPVSEQFEVDSDAFETPPSADDEARSHFWKYLTREDDTPDSWTVDQGSDSDSDEWSHRDIDEVPWVSSDEPTDAEIRNIQNER